jgi:hypothetical protein
MADADAAARSMDRPPYHAVIHPSGAVTFAYSKPDYLDIRRAVMGHLEAVPHRAPEDITAYCNEEGKLYGLPVNIPATLFLRMVGDVLVGPTSDGMMRSHRSARAGEASGRRTR